MCANYGIRNIKQQLQRKEMFEEKLFGKIIEIGLLIGSRKWTTNVVREDSDWDFIITTKQEEKILDGIEKYNSSSNGNEPIHYRYINGSSGDGETNVNTLNNDNNIKIYLSEIDVVINLITYRNEENIKNWLKIDEVMCNSGKAIEDKSIRILYCEALAEVYLNWDIDKSDFI